MTDNIQEIFSAQEKATIAEGILRELPDWFGIEESLQNYVDQTRSLPFFAAYASQTPVGFVAVLPHTDYAAEVCVMGILQSHHRQGIGRRLIGRCEQYARDNRLEFLTVKTLSADREDEAYARTREFYGAMGFRPLEVFPLLWDESNPCLLMAKYIGNAQPN